MSDIQQGMCDEFLLEQIRVLLHRESFYIISSTAEKNHRPPLQHIRYRHKILEWFYKTADHFQFDREVVTISMDYVDRFLLLHPSAEEISSRTYQLVAMTSLYVAAKLRIGDNSHAHSQNDISQRRVVCLQEYADLSSGEFSPRDILSMELCVLGTLNWNMNPVSPLSFTYHFLSLMGPINEDEIVNIPSNSTTSMDEGGFSINMDLTKEVLHELSLYFTELAVSLPEITPYFHLDSGENDSIDCFTFAPSTIAFASILLSMEAISNTALPSYIRKSFLQRCAELTRQSNYILHPNRIDIQKLKAMIKMSFRPKVFLSQTTTENGQTFNKDNSIYPIEIGIRNGILKSKFLEELSSSHVTYPGIKQSIKYSCRSPSPTSSLDGPHSTYTRSLSPISSIDESYPSYTRSPSLTSSSDEPRLACTRSPSPTSAMDEMDELHLHMATRNP